MQKKTSMLQRMLAFFASWRAPFSKPAHVSGAKNLTTKKKKPPPMIRGVVARILPDMTMFFFQPMV